MSGTLLIRDIVSGSVGSLPIDMVNFSNNVYFSVGQLAYGALTPTDNGYPSHPQLWRTNGDSAGTVLIKDFGADADIVSLEAAQNRLYMLVKRQVMPFDQTQFDLWALQSNSSTPVLIKSIDVSPITRLSSLSTVTAGKDAYWVQYDVGTDTNTVWHISAATNRVDKLLSLSDGYVQTIFVGNAVYLRLAKQISSGVYANQLWKTNGTISGTTQIYDFGVRHIDQVFNWFGSTLVSVIDYDSGQTQIWKVEGNNLVTVPEIEPFNGHIFSNPVPSNPNRLYLVHDDGQTGAELYKIDVVTGSAPYLDMSTLAPIYANGVVPIAIQYGNLGATTSQSLTLSITLGISLTYQSNSLNVTPTISGTQLIWQLPDVGFLEQRAFDLQVRAPDSTIGTKIPITVTLSAANASESSVVTQVTKALQIYLPQALR